MIRIKPPKNHVSAVHLQGCTWVLFQLLLLPERPRMALELPFASPPGGVFPQGSSWKKRSSNGTNHTSQGGRDPISGKRKGRGKLTQLIRDHAHSGMNLNGETNTGWFDLLFLHLYVKSVTSFCSGATCLALFFILYGNLYESGRVIPWKWCFFFSVVVSFKLKRNKSLGRCSQERCRRGYQKQIILKEWWF